MANAKPEEVRAVTDPDEIIARLIEPYSDHHTWLHHLRDVAPVFKSKHVRMHEGWVMTRYVDVNTVLRDRRFVSDARGVKIFDDGKNSAFFHMMRRMMLFLDPPDHVRVRGTVSRAFTPRAVAERNARFHELIEGLLDRATEKGHMELVSELAYPMPVAVICDMLGVPHEDVPLFETWMSDFQRRGDVQSLTPEIEERGEASCQGFEDYFTGLLRDRRKRPAEDLMTALVQAADATREISDDELIAACVLLLQAGHGTTADVLGLGTLALLRNRDQLERLQREPQRLAAAVEELIRYDTSVTLSQRVALEDVEIGGCQIAAGDFCVLMNTAANRDPARFPDPDRLDIGREDNEHLSFSLGSHRCLGASLARVELLAAFGALVTRLPGLELAGEPVFRPALMMRGLERLPVSW